MGEERKEKNAMERSGRRNAEGGWGGCGVVGRGDGDGDGDGKSEEQGR